MNKKISITSLCFILIIIGIFTFTNSEESIAKDYYNSVFDEANIIYSEISKLLIIEDLDQLEKIYKNVSKSGNRIHYFKTNDSTKTGEEIMENIFLYVYRSIHLKEREIKGLKKRYRDNLFEDINLIRDEIKTLSQISEKKMDLNSKED